jgi:hypothetical protein
MARHFKLVGTHAVSILARLAARNIVKEQLRDQGVRVTLVSIREITERAQQYLAEHPELYQQALERARQMGMIEIREPIVTPTQNALLARHIAQKRALKRLSFFLQLLRFSVAGAY